MYSNLYLLQLLCLTFFIFNNFNLQAQNQERDVLFSDTDCGTTLAEDAHPEVQKQLDLLWQEKRQFYRQLAQDFRDNPSKNIGNIRMIPVQLHIIRTTAGTGGISEADFTAALDFANASLIPGGIHLYQCGTFNYIDDDNYADYDKTEMTDLHDTHGVDDVLNIYTADDVAGSTGSPICGHAQFPGGLDFAMVDVSCTRNGSTFVHEVGHYFNVYHTHESFLGDELVDGTNCATHGDLVCDTEADPRLSSSTNFTNDGCIYDGNGGTETDANGAFYTPPVSNIMSYASKECRFVFTTGQYARMLFAIDNFRTNLTCSPDLAAKFYSHPEVSCSDNLSVDFSSVSTAATNWAWDFGDGATSTMEAPTHTYTTAGTYDVALTVGDGANTDTETKNYEIVVGAVDLPYVQDFEAGVAALSDFKEVLRLKNALLVDGDAAESGNFGLLLEGSNNSSPSFQTPTSSDAFEELWNYHCKSSTYLCVDATMVSDLTLNFNLRQMHGFNDNYTNFRITVDGTPIGNVYQPFGSDGTWSSETVDLSAYAGSVITVGFEGSHKYSRVEQATNFNATYIDNIELSGTVALPVELLTFEAQPQDNQSVQLTWATASQKNFSHFELEHATDAHTFKKFKTVNTSARNSSYKIEYKDSHERPVSSRNYYRLKMIDLNGKAEYSDIRSVDFEQLVRAFHVFPNPIQQGTALKISLNTVKTVQLKIYSPSGQFVKAVDLKNGWNEIPTSAWTAGTYFYTISSGDMLENGRFLLVD